MDSQERIVLWSIISSENNENNGAAPRHVAAPVGGGGSVDEASETQKPRDRVHGTLVCHCNEASLPDWDHWWDEHHDPEKMPCSCSSRLLFTIFFFVEEHGPLESGQDRLERFPFPEQFSNLEDVVDRDDHQFWVRCDVLRSRFNGGEEVDEVAECGPNGLKGMRS
jgi:hypothetical protein